MLIVQLIVCASLLLLTKLILLTRLFGDLAFSISDHPSFFE